MLAPFLPNLFFSFLPFSNQALIDPYESNQRELLIRYTYTKLVAGLALLPVKYYILSSTACVIWDIAAQPFGRHSRRHIAGDRCSGRPTPPLGQ
jgi:hypothetical protein